MPIFDYICNKCKKTETRLVKFESMENQFCDECGNEDKMERVPSFSTSFILKGSGWFKKGGY
jgi:putative FmdB family regulatory protein